jgi:hypothetical protein
MRQQGKGQSRDISEMGAFVLAADCPPLGANVGLSMDLEAFPSATNFSLIEFEGQVVRVDRSDGKAENGFAVKRKSS